MQRNSNQIETNAWHFAVTRIDKAIIAISVAILLLVPLGFHPHLNRMFATPKLALLILGCSALLPLLALRAFNRAEARMERLRLARLEIRIVIVLVAWAGISTVRGLTPAGSLVGTPFNFMGLLTHVCFLLCFLGLLAGIGSSLDRLRIVLQAIALAGFLASIPAVLQHLGVDPLFVSGIVNTSITGGTLGHPNYLGHFLVFCMPVSLTLALESRGYPRYFMIVCATAAVVAAALSGSRGAWLGLAAALLVILGPHLRQLLEKVRAGFRGFPVTSCLLLFSLPSLVIVVPMVTGAQPGIWSGIHDRDAGSGRLLLWRSVVSMPGEYLAAGTGPDGFRRAFLSHKTESLARHSPRTGHESAHNSALDSLITQGLPGLGLRIIALALALILLSMARRRSRRSWVRTAATAQLAALVGATVHGMFIHEQITTGLYLFAFLALAVATYGISSVEVERPGSKRSDPPTLGYARTTASGLAIVISAAGVVLVVDLIWSDHLLNRALRSAETGGTGQVLQLGQRATALFDPGGIHSYVFLAALARSVEVAGLPGDESPENPGLRSEAFKKGNELESRVIDQGLLPETGAMLLSYLALQAGNIERARHYSQTAIRLDPYLAGAHYIMSRAELAEGRLEQAAASAATAYDLDPSFEPGRLHYREVRTRLRNQYRASLTDSQAAFD